MIITMAVSAQEGEIEDVWSHIEQQGLQRNRVRRNPRQAEPAQSLEAVA